MITKKNIDTNHTTYWMTCLLSNYAVCCNYFTRKDVDVFFDDYFKEFQNDFANPFIFFNNNYLFRFINEPLFAIHYQTQFQKYLADYLHYRNGNIGIYYLMMRYAPIFTIQFHIRTYRGFIPYSQNQGADIGGYPFIKLLHDNIHQIHFEDCRKLVNVSCISKDMNGNFEANEFNFKNQNDLCDYMKQNEVLVNAYDSAIGHSLTIYCDSDSQLFFVHNTNNPTKDQVLKDDWINSYQHFLLYERK